MGQREARRLQARPRIESDRSRPRIPRCGFDACNPLLSGRERSWRRKAAHALAARSLLFLFLFLAIRSSPALPRLVFTDLFIGRFQEKVIHQIFMVLLCGAAKSYASIFSCDIFLVV
ncbi:unnamed protein product [Musa textilis]